MLGGISIWQLLIVLGIVVLVFGTKKLRNTGSDLGTAIRNFKSSMKEGQDGHDGSQENPATGEPQGKVIDADVVKETRKSDSNERT